ncbi:tetratricopeptide repeat protein [Helicobacter labacensis]|uniref:tetratricopeptide repeat protein n=1 Tax=Helicobacter labacensis TaxID=2316079 RepID=UPI000EAD4A8F|nr:SEL1-like repeat protein [Helicobacter labacensis]
MRMALWIGGIVLGVGVLGALEGVDAYLAEAKKAYRDRHYSKALEYYQEAANLGSAEGYRGLANMYLIGAGVKQDSQKARAYFKKAMELRHEPQKPPHSPKSITTTPTQAQDYMRLGEGYAKGQGVALDFNKAMQAFEKAAKLGDGRGFNAIADMYYNENQGVEQNYPKALEYYQKAAKMGQARDFRLGMMYAKGQGVAQDYAKALEYLHKAGKKGDGRAWQQLGSMYFEGKGAPLNYQQARAYYQEAIKCYLEAGQQGDGRAFLRLAQMYERGQGVAQDYAKAFEYYQKATDLKSADGAYHLATLILRHKIQGVSEDRSQISARYQQAIALYQEEGKNGDASAYAKLGFIYQHGLYYNGWLLNKDAKLALEYYQKGAQMGNAQSYYEIGEAYRRAQGAPYDLQKANQHYQKACALGYKSACH